MMKSKKCGKLLPHPSYAKCFPCAKYYYFPLNQWDYYSDMEDCIEHIKPIGIARSYLGWFLVRENSENQECNFLECLVVLWLKGCFKVSDAKNRHISRKYPKID